MTEIKVQVIEEDTGEIAFIPKMLPDFSERVDDLGDSLNDIASRLRSRLQQLGKQAGEWGLDEVTLTFSLDLQAQGGVVVARGSAAAGFQAALTWRRTTPNGQD